MQFLNRNNKILFINPFYYPNHRFSGITPGIAYLRGFLQHKGINSFVINFNDILINEEFKNKDILKKNKDYLISKIKEKNEFFREKASWRLLLNSFLDECPNEIWKFVNENDFYDNFFKEYFSNLINFNFLGISITSRTQVLFSLSLVKYIKKILNKNIKVVVGGAFVTSNYSEFIFLLKQNPIIDYLIVGEGETPLYLLLQGHNKYNLSKIPNLIYLDKGIYISSKKLNHTEDIRELPSPIFNPGDTPYIQTTRKCYWNRCAYCVLDSNKFLKNVSVRCVKNVINDIESIQHSLGESSSKYIFTDNSLPVFFLKNFLEKISKIDTFPENFRAFLRLEPQLLDHDIIKLVRERKFCFAFGLETSVPRLSRLINKGINIKKALEIIKIYSELDLEIIIFFMIGLPTQTKEELIMDLNLMSSLVSNNKNVWIVTKLFTLKKNSIIYENPQKYGIKLFLNRKNFLSDAIPFKQISVKSIYSEEALLIASDFFNNNPVLRKHTPFYHSHVETFTLE